MIEYLKNIVFFNSKTVFGFTTFYFWAFFAVVLIGYTIFCKKNAWRSVYMLLVSLFFYYKTSGFFFIILISTTIINYFLGNLIYKNEKKSTKIIFLTISTFANLLILSYFKYTYLFIGAINQLFGCEIPIYDYILDITNIFAGTHFDSTRILLPAGISFYMFQTMSYTIDLYKKKIEPVKNIIDFGFFVSFFPSLVAGPIVRASDFVPQIYKKFEVSRYDFGMAIFLILKGLTKKIMLGDYLAVNFIDRIFSMPERYSGFENLLATVAYSMQVYLDFSAYSDIAIGIALLMGFRIPANFNSPYKAKNCGDFWKRWHISLSTWLKDYLYIPLGGNRRASPGTFINAAILISIFIFLSAHWIIVISIAAIVLILTMLALVFPKTQKQIITNTNLMITMLLGGLWHGSSWNFLIWGGLNGLGIVVYKFWKKISPYEKINSWWANSLKILITFSFITFTRIFFRASDFDSAKTVMNQIWNNFNVSIIPQILLGYWKVVLVLIVAFVTHWLSNNLKNKVRDRFIALPHWTKAIVTVCAVFVIYQMVCADAQPFIYFQF